MKQHVIQVDSVLQVNNKFIMPQDVVKKRINELVYLLRYYDFMYYIKNTSIITDYEYDKLKQELENLENEYPHLIMSNSPTNYVGFANDNSLEVKPHIKPMLSLKNSYDIYDIIAHITKHKLLPVLIETKIDGISLSIIYNNGIFQEALLRGDGYEGEDVTNIIAFTDIVLSIADKNLINIRGEVYINISDLMTINEKRIQSGLKVFKTCRNCVSGILRQKTQEYVEYLKFFPYYIDGLLIDTQENVHRQLNIYGFTNLPHVYCDNIDEVEEKIHLIQNNTSTFNIDGVVIKPNNLKLIEDLGITKRYPKALIAYKFSQSNHEVVLKNIKWQVTRTYKIIPIGEIDTIIIDGADIKNIYLYNKRYVQNNNININSKIIIERVGGTAPQIKSIVEEKEKIHLINCPVCHIKVIEDEINYFCNNPHCQGVVKDNLLYFCEILNFKGLGEENIESIIIKENIIYPSQLLSIIINNHLSYINGYEKIQDFIKNKCHHIDMFCLLRAYGFSQNDLKNFHNLITDELLKKKLSIYYQDIHEYKNEIETSLKIITSIHKNQ